MNQSETESQMLYFECDLSSVVVLQLECVGSVDSGLRCMAWSPDQELVVFMTGLSYYF